VDFRFVFVIFFPDFSAQKCEVSFGCDNAVHVQRSDGQFLQLQKKYLLEENEKKMHIAKKKCII
jgi:hypothetical protein